MGVTMDAIQRVADAIAKLPVRDNFDPGGELDQLRLREAARAAIEALRKPSAHAFCPDLNDVLWNREIDRLLGHR